MSVRNYDEEKIVKAIISALEMLEDKGTSTVAAKDVTVKVHVQEAVGQVDDVPDEKLPDIAMIPEDEICFVDHLKNREAILELKKTTPARTLSGRVGDREKTEIVFRKNANLSAMVDAVWKPLDREFVKKMGYPIIKTKPNSKDEYLMRPDLGRELDEENLEIVRTKLKKNPDVQIVLGEGQSVLGLETSMPEMLPALLQGLEANHIDYGTPIFVEYTRVGVGDLIGKTVGAKVVCVILGERPGHLSWRGLGCYVTYAPEVGILESKRTAVTTIQDDGGTPPAEAGAYVADLIKRILQEKKSGVDLVL